MNEVKRRTESTKMRDLKFCTSKINWKDRASNKCHRGLPPRHRVPIQLSPESRLDCIRIRSEAREPPFQPTKCNRISINAQIICNFFDCCNDAEYKIRQNIDYLINAQPEKPENKTNTQC